MPTYGAKRGRDQIWKGYFSCTRKGKDVVANTSVVNENIGQLRPGDSNQLWIGMVAGMGDEVNTDRKEQEEVVMDIWDHISGKMLGPVKGQEAR